MPFFLIAVADDVSKVKKLSILYCAYWRFHIADILFDHWVQFLINRSSIILVETGGVN